MIELKILAALSENNVIGDNGRTPWYQPDDLRRFELLTQGHPVIVGRKKLEAMWMRYCGRLPTNREYIVLSKTRDGLGSGLDIARDFREAVEMAELSGDRLRTNLAYVLGGERVYRSALASPATIAMELTHVKGAYCGDAYFPLVDWSEWTEVNREFFDRPDYSLAAYRRAA